MRGWPLTVNLPGIAIAADLSFGIALLSTLMEIFISLLEFLCATTITRMEMRLRVGWVKRLRLGREENYGESRAVSIVR